MTNKEIIKFGKHYIKKRKFDSMEKAVNGNHVNINNILVSSTYHVAKYLKYFASCYIIYNGSFKLLLIILIYIKIYKKFWKSKTHASYGQWKPWKNLNKYFLNKG